MDDKGQIHELTPEQHDKMVQDRLEKLHSRERQTLTPITESEALFFRSKGPAFRALWGKRFARGLTPEQKEQLAELMRRTTPR